jgi:peptidyl-prolyl cis-trans isomerase D
MFDLFRSRQKAVRYFLGGILLIIAVSMVVTLIPGYGTSTNTNPDDPVLANIGNSTITAQEAARQAQRILQGNQIPPDMIEVYLPQFVDSMIQQRALIYEFERMGLTATDDEVLAALQQGFPQAFTNGVLTGQAQLEAALAQQGMTLQDVIDATRSDVLLKKIQDLEFAAAVVSPKEVDAELARKYERAKIKYIAFPPAKFHDSVKPTPEAIKTYFDTHRYLYTIPEKRTFEVLVIEQDKVEESINVTDAQLRAAYSANMDNFRTPERVHARHILVKTVDKSDADKKQLLAKAQDLLKQINGGGDFAELAKKNSDDAADKGGDLGWITRGQTVPEFEKAVFALKPKETSGIVTTTYGYHIIQALEHEPARVKPFDEVKASLADDLKKQGISDKMEALGDQVRAALAKSPGSAAEIAKQLNVQLITVDKAEANQAIPGLGVSPEIDGALASLNKNDVSQVLVLPANRLAIAELLDKTPARQADFNEVETRVKDAVIDNDATVVAKDKAAEAATKLKAGEDMDKVAKSMKLDVVESVDFSHTDAVEGLGQAALVSDAFNKPVGSIIGPVLVVGRYVDYKIIDQKQVDVTKLAQERAAIVVDLKKRKGQANNALFMDSVMTKLEAEGKVKIHHDAIKRLVASFHQ